MDRRELDLLSTRTGGDRVRLRPDLGDIQIRPNPRLLAQLPSTLGRSSAGDIDVL
jgi:hypothetical protein